MKVVAERNWSWMLFNTDDEYILSVACGSIGIYTCEIVLTDKEINDYQVLGEKALEELARDIRFFHSKYQSRQVPDFHLNEESRLAAKKWRASHGQMP